MRIAFSIAKRGAPRRRGTSGSCRCCCGCSPTTCAGCGPGGATSARSPGSRRAAWHAASRAASTAWSCSSAARSSRRAARRCCGRGSASTSRSRSSCSSRCLHTSRSRCTCCDTVGRMSDNPPRFATAGDDMADLIFHHFDTSPFSEKVRLVFGFKQLTWRSVKVPVMLPKPDVVALTGGYRRTPILQIGADVYCDTALICRAIEQRAPQPTLFPPAASALQHIVAQWADSALFWAAVPYTTQPAGMAYLFGDASPEHLKALAADRAAMLGGMKRPTATDGTAQLRNYLGW